MAERLFITAARLREVLDYDPHTGWFTWRVMIGQRCKIGGRAGCLMRRDIRQYRVLQVYGRLYQEQNLAWLWMTGEWPSHEVDHRNNDATDNSWKNLRPATRSQNMQNTKRRVDSTTGFKGVCAHHGRFDARVQIEGRRIFVGSFKTPEEASAAIVKRRRELHGDYCNHG